MYKFIYVTIIAAVISVGAVIMENSISSDLDNGIIRLHIIADNDTKEAQEIKLKVRDAVLANANPYNFLQTAEDSANYVLLENNQPYKATAQYGKFYFPKKEYNGITLPKGEYYGVKIVLGSGKGKNWWCIMYPPLCAVNETEMELTKSSQKILSSKLSPQSYELVTSSGDKIKIRFKTAEILRSLKEVLF